MLVRHGSTDAVRSASFGGDEPLDAGGLAAARALRGRLPRAGERYVSPALRARQTAAAAGLDHAVVDAALGECDFGRWAGRRLADVHAEDPAAAIAWMTDPAAAPHHGESLLDLLARVGSWLEQQAARAGAAVAVTHGGVVKAAVVHALCAPPDAFWRIDASPLALTELHAHDGRWTVARVNAPALAETDAGSRATGPAPAATDRTSAPIESAQAPA